ncbi:MAG: ERCC4 domain-containing protein, partial [Armatimonadota bacterium]
MFKATVRAAAPDGTIAALLAAKGIAVEPLDGAPEKCDRFVLSRRIAVDRRATSDFLRAIGDKRLFVHARDLSDNFPVPVIVIEGEDLYGVRAFHPNAIHGAISALIVQYGCSVLRTGSEAETAALIAVMATHEQEGVPEISL